METYEEEIFLQEQDEGEAFAVERGFQEIQTPQEDEKSRNYKPEAVIILMVTLLFLAIGSLIYVVFVTKSGTESGTESRKKSGTDSASNGSDTIIPESRIILPPATSPSTSATQITNVTSTWIKTTTATPLARLPTTTTETRLQMVWKPIICSYGIWLASSKVATQPGICDYIFLDSLYYKNPRVTIFDIEYSGIQWFIDVITEHSKNATSKTKFGLFINYKDAVTANNDINTPEGLRGIAVLWHAGIHHYGVQRVEMSTNLLAGGARDILRVFDLMKVEDLSSVPQASDKKGKASAERVTIEEPARVIQKLKTAKRRVFNLEQELQVERSLSRRLQEQVLALLANNTQPDSPACLAEAPASTYGFPAAPARAVLAAPARAAPAASTRAALAAPAHAAPAAPARAAPAAPARAAPTAPAHAAPAAPARAAPAAPACAALSAPDHAAPAVERDGDPPAADAPAAGLVQGPPEAPAEFVPLFAEVCDRVYLGNGVLVRADKMAYFMGARGDSMFVNEAAKVVFGRENLQMRSVTGKPCRRFKGAMAKRALTPAKVEAVRNAFHKYVDRNPREKSPSKRIALINHYLSELLQDINKKLDF